MENGVSEDDTTFNATSLPDFGGTDKALSSLTAATSSQIAAPAYTDPATSGVSANSDDYSSLPGTNSATGSFSADSGLQTGSAASTVNTVSGANSTINDPGDDGSQTGSDDSSQTDSDELTQTGSEDPSETGSEDPTQTGLNGNSTISSPANATSSDSDVSFPSVSNSVRLPSACLAGFQRLPMFQYSLDIGFSFI